MSFRRSRRIRSSRSSLRPPFGCVFGLPIDRPNNPLAAQDCIDFTDSGWEEFRGLLDLQRESGWDAVCQFGFNLETDCGGRGHGKIRLMFACRHPSPQMTFASQLEHYVCKFMKIGCLFSLTFHSIRHTLGRMCGRYRRKSDKQRVAEVFRSKSAWTTFPTKRATISVRSCSSNNLPAIRKDASFSPFIQSS